MRPATLIKRAREKKGWSQKHLAEAIGVTPGFINKIEQDHALPSYESCLVLADVLDLAFDNLWMEVEQARAAAAANNIQTRGIAVRNALRTQSSRAAGPPPAAPVPAMDPEAIAAEVARDPELQTAFSHLKQALADPQMRPTVLAALAAFAQAARPQP